MMGEVYKTGWRKMEASTTLQRKKEREKTGTAFVREVILQGVYFLLGLLVSRGAVLGELAPFGASFFITQE